MKIEYVHASKYGNGARVAAEFEEQMAAKGVEVNVHHVREVNAKALPPADLYVFSSPGRMGRPLGAVRRFLKQLALPPGTPYAILNTEAAPRPDKKTGRVPTEEEIAKWQHVRPIMKEILSGKGLVEVAEDKVLVTGMKGPSGGRLAAQSRRLRCADPGLGRGAHRPGSRGDACVSPPASPTARRGRRPGTRSAAVPAVRRRPLLPVSAGRCELWTRCDSGSSVPRQAWHRLEGVRDVGDQGTDQKQP